MKLALTTLTLLLAGCVYASAQQQYNQNQHSQAPPQKPARLEPTNNPPPRTKLIGSKQKTTPPASSKEKVNPFVLAKEKPNPITTPSPATQIPYSVGRYVGEDSWLMTFEQETDLLLEQLDDMIEVEALAFTGVTLADNYRNNRNAQLNDYYNQVIANKSSATIRNFYRKSLGDYHQDMLKYLTFNIANLEIIREKAISDDKSVDWLLRYRENDSNENPKYTDEQILTILELTIESNQKIHDHIKNILLPKITLGNAG